MILLEIQRLRETIANMEINSCYVDDIFCVVESGTEVYRDLYDFNNAHNMISCTIESEKGGRFWFLYVPLTRTS